MATGQRRRPEAGFRVIRHETTQSPPRRSRSGVCVEEYGFSVIVGERVLVHRFIDPIPARRIGTALALGIYPNALLPQAQAFEYFLDHITFVDEGHDPHLALAVGANEGIRFPDLLDEVAPLFGGNAAGLVFGNVDDLQALLHLFSYGATRR